MCSSVLPSPEMQETFEMSQHLELMLLAWLGTNLQRSTSAALPHEDDG